VVGVACEVVLELTKVTFRFGDDAKCAWSRSVRLDICVGCCSLFLCTLKYCVVADLYRPARNDDVADLSGSLSPSIRGVFNRQRWFKSCTQALDAWADRYDSRTSSQQSTYTALVPLLYPEPRLSQAADSIMVFILAYCSR